MPGVEGFERQDYDECEAGVRIPRCSRFAQNLKTQRALRKAAENAEKNLIFDQVRPIGSHVSQNRRDPSTGLRAGCGASHEDQGDREGGVSSRMMAEI